MQLNTHLNKDRQIVDVIFKLNGVFLGGGGARFNDTGIMQEKVYMNA